MSTGAAGPIVDGTIVGTAGIRPWRPFWSALQAEICLRSGRPVDAHRHVDAAFAEAEAMGGSFCLPELHRLRGELLAPVEPAEALTSLRTAVTVAEEQGAALYRSRAEASLAGLSASRA